MKLIAIILTPIQYLNLLEFFATNKFLNQRDCIVFVPNENPVSIRQIKDIGFIETFEKFIIPLENSKSRFRLILFSLFYLNSNCNRVPIIGNLNNVFCQTLIGKRKTTFVLDDGTNSINHLNSRANNKFSLKKSRIISSNLYETTLKIVFNRKTKNVDKLVFFTCYNGLMGFRNDVVQINTYDFIKSYYSIDAHKTVSECWFVGAPFIRLGIFTSNDYARLLDDILLFFKLKNVRLRYFSHRVDKDINLSEEITVERNEMPFELFYLTSVNRPKYVASFYSSCLKNIEILDKAVELNSFYIPEIMRNEKLSNVWDNVEQVYHYFKKHTRIKVISDYSVIKPV